MVKKKKKPISSKNILDEAAKCINLLRFLKDNKMKYLILGEVCTGSYSYLIQIFI